MQADDRISVVVPVHDGARYLGDALRSIVEQTLPPFEVLVVDDGSTDGSRSLAESFGPPVRCVSQPHSGIGAAKARGVSLARGAFFAFLDADDVWEPTKLERQAAALAGEPEIDLVFGHVREFVSPDLEAAAAERLLVHLEPRPAFLLQAMLARRRAFDLVGAFEPVRVPDLDWLLRARERGVRWIVLPHVVVRRRLHRGNLTRSDPLINDYVRVLKASLDRRRAAG